MEEFKTSSKMRNLNIEFGQQAFINGFELCEGRVVRRFPELDLHFLKEEEDNIEAGPDDAIVDPSSVELAFDPSESTMKVPELVWEPKVAESALAPSSITPSEVEILE
ncbi:hypothetical protein COCNU_scaffold009332G000010 [Cocos nucifera]|nr:hypothetical protein [Cocos nucifera]